MRSGHAPTGWLTAFIVAILTLNSAPAVAQDPDPIFDVAGFVNNRAYEELAPFESIDTLTGNVLLTFTDLVLPGDAGRNIEILRVYNSKPSHPWTGGREWDFGIAGVPMRVLMPTGPPSDPDEESWWPIFLTVDGGRHQGIPTSAPTTSTTRFRTKDFWEYRSSDRLLYLPSGLICEYNSDGYLIRISHVHGELATISWTPGLAPELSNITQRVSGDTRAITFSYSGNTKTMTSGNRTWTYTYSSTHLLTAQPPVGPSWQFTYRTSGYQSLETITTPHGGRITYDWMNAPFRKPGGGVDHFSWALIERSTSMNVAPGEWTYSYTYNPSTDTLVTTVQHPDVTKKYSYKYVLPPTSTAESTMPRLSSIEVRTRPNATLVQREDFVYELGDVVSWRDSDQLLKTSHTTERGGRTYATQFTYQGVFDNYGQPSRIEATGHFRRVTRRELYTNLRTPFSTGFAYRPFLLNSEWVEDASNGTAKFTTTWDYDSRGFRDREVAHGIERRFQRNQQGNTTVEIDGRNRETRYTFRWGVVDTTTTPEYTINRTINADSTVATEQRNGFTTSYQYDGLFRRTLVTPPTGLATQTTFQGGNTITVGRGSVSKTYTLDGFGRVLLEQDDAGVKRRYEYDEYGRKTFETLPYTTALPQPGTTWIYDELGRPTKETYADNTNKTFQYLADGEVLITDEQSRATRQRWQATGSPEDRRLGSLVDPAGNTFSYLYNELGRLVQVQHPGGASPRSWVYVSGKDLVQSETHPESGTTTYQYDGAGLLSQRTDSAGQLFVYTYDGNQRLTKIDAPGTVDDQEFDYDDTDNRTLAKNGHVTSRFIYDGANRLKKRTDTFADLTQDVITEYTYTTLDAVDVITYPSGNTADYDYDAHGRLREVKANKGIIHGAVFTVLSRHPSGAPASVQFGNGVTETRTFDTRYRPDTIGLPGLNLDYDYYAAGSVRQVTGTRPNTSQAFEYDAIDRLSRYTRGAFSAVYGYDALGNRTSAAGMSYTYNSTTLRANYLSYDTLGRVVGDGQATYTYTPFGMAATATVGTAVTQYRYDADNLRKVTIPASGFTEYAIHGQGSAPQVLSEGFGVNNLFSWRYNYVYAEGQLVARLRPDPPAYAGLEAPTYVSVEEGGTATQRVRLRTFDGQPTREPLEIRWTTLVDLATADDFQHTTAGTLNVPVGTASGHVFSIDLPTVEDTNIEPDEWFWLYLTHSPTVMIDGFYFGNIVIVNDDHPSPIHVALEQPEYSVSEGVGAAGLVFRLTTDNGLPTQRAFKVRYRTNAGTALAPEDYQHVDSEFTFGVGSTPGNYPFSVNIMSDALYEATESFTFSITPDAGIIVDRGQATVNILNDDPVPPVLPIVGFSTAAQQVSEGAGSIVVGLLVDTQGLPATIAPVNVVIATQNGTATAGSDYVAVSGPYTIPVGTLNGAVIAAPVGIVNDNTVEANEQFTINIVGGFGANPGILTQTITIVDDDAITVSFDPAAVSVAESAGAAPVNIKVTTASGQPTSRVVTVNYATVQSTATAGLDFTAAAGPLTIAAGTANGTVIGAPLPIFNDGMDEPDEVYGVVLTSPDGSATVGAPLPITIVDDDAPGSNIQIDLTVAQQAIGEASGSAPISIRITTANGGPTAVVIPLSFWTAPGSATANVDFAALNSGVPIAAGTASGTVVSSAIGIVNDAVDEPVETFTINLGMPLPAVSIVPTQTIAIYDDDPGPHGARAATSGDQGRGFVFAPPDAKRSVTGQWIVGPPPAIAPQPVTWTTKPPAPEPLGQSKQGRQ